MEIIETKRLSFTYPNGSGKALDGVSFGVKPSEMVVICGKSGCGKSTLLRHLKKNLTPYGQVSGEALYNGLPIKDMDAITGATQIGFVQQNPDNQLVTDRVWHELAFGLESLGEDNETIRRRVAEMASFFGIQTWFRREVAKLSGGQKQLLNLASIMVMQPKVLILDEPTSQLDPIAASEFIKTVYRINREIGTTVIISEHRLEELFTMADRVMVMDGGRVASYDAPWSLGQAMFFGEDGEHSPMFYGLPAVMKIYASCRAKGFPPLMRSGSEYEPLTVRDGRLWLESALESAQDSGLEGAPESSLERAPKSAPESAPKGEGSNGFKAEGGKAGHPDDDNTIEVSGAGFAYGKAGDRVLCGVNMKVRRGELFCLLGGNGVGKSTLLKAIAGIIELQDGRITVDGIRVKKNNLKELYSGHLAMVPQNPQALFTEITVEEELIEALHHTALSSAEKAERIEKMVDTMELGELRESHPYDLSGGEQQRLAIGKILLLSPKVLLLDEPTKGLDPFFKRTLASILKGLTAEGVTVLVVSHDIEFCAEYGDRCGMFFDGDLISCDAPGAFFAGNSFYTTTANRMARRWFPEAVTWEEVTKCLEQAMTNRS